MRCRSIAAVGRSAIPFLSPPDTVIALLGRLCSKWGAPQGSKTKPLNGVTAMEVYIGFDISLQTTHVCVVDNEGKIMREGVASSDVRFP